MEIIKKIEKFNSDIFVTGLPPDSEQLSEQTDKLAKFILKEFEGEYPNTSESAIDCAIRIIKDLKNNQCKLKTTKRKC